MTTAKSSRNQKKSSKSIILPGNKALILCVQSSGWCRRRGQGLPTVAEFQVGETGQTNTCVWSSLSTGCWDRGAADRFVAPKCSPLSEGRRPWIFNQADDPSQTGAELSWVVWVSHSLDCKTERRGRTIFIDLGPIFFLTLFATLNLCTLLPAASCLDNRKHFP